MIPSTLQAELRRAQVAAVELRKDAQLKKAIAERKAKLVLFICCLLMRSITSLLHWHCSACPFGNQVYGAESLCEVIV